MAVELPALFDDAHADFHRSDGSAWRGFSFTHELWGSFKAVVPDVRLRQPITHVPCASLAHAMAFLEASYAPGEIGEVRWDYAVKEGGVRTRERRPVPALSAAGLCACAMSGVSRVVSDV